MAVVRSECGGRTTRYTGVDGVERGDCAVCTEVVEIDPEEGTVVHLDSSR